MNRKYILCIFTYLWGRLRKAPYLSLMHTKGHQVEGGVNLFQMVPEVKIRINKFHSVKWSLPRLRTYQQYHLTKIKYTWETVNLYKRYLNNGDLQGIQFKREHWGNFPGPVIRTLHFQCWGWGFKKKKLTFTHPGHSFPKTKWVMSSKLNYFLSVTGTVEYIFLIS